MPVKRDGVAAGILWAVLTVLGILAVLVLESIALVRGIDGAMLSSSFAAIGGLVGYVFGRGAHAASVES